MILRSLEQEMLAADRRGQAIPVDLGAGAATVDACEQTLRYFSKVDIIVNDAADQFFTPIGEMTTAEFTRSVAVNLIAPFNIIRTLVPRMIDQGEGWIDRQYRV